MKTLISLSACLLLLLSSTSFAQPRYNTQFCSLQTLKTDKTLLKNLNFSEDPIGLAAEAKIKDAEVDKLFQSYAIQHHCTLYAISMMDLVKGLLKGSTSMISQGNSPASPPSSMQNMSKKYLLVEGDKAACIKKLGLQLPLQTFLPKAPSKKGVRS